MKANLLISFFSMLSILHLLGCSSCSGSDQDEPQPPVQEPTKEYVIYEVYPGLFAKNSAFNRIADQLDNIKELGANVVWLMPIYEQGSLNAIGSPYCVKDYQKINPNYGTTADLKSLVSKAHSKEMIVILDWVANHTSWDHSWIQHKTWYTQESGGNIVSPPGMGWNDVADLNFDNPDMRKAMIDAMKYWITEFDIDGYRCDFAEGVPGDFWQAAISELKVLKGGELFMLAEGGNISLLNHGFDMLYGWDFAFKLQDVYAGKATPADLYKVHEQEYQNLPKGKQRMRYSTNHDMSSEKSAIQAYGGEQGALSAYVIASTLAGAPMIYSSQEIGYDRPLSFFENRVIDWNSNPEYRATYKRLMSIYRSSEALRSGELKRYDTGSVAGYSRSADNETVLILVNTTANEEQVKVPIEFAHENMENLMENNTITLSTAITMSPYQYLILKKPTK